MEGDSLITLFKHKPYLVKDKSDQQGGGEGAKTTKISTTWFMHDPQVGVERAGKYAARAEPSQNAFWKILARAEPSQTAWQIFLARAKTSYE